MATATMTMTTISHGRSLRKEMRFLAGWGASGFDLGALDWSVLAIIFFFIGRHLRDERMQATVQKNFYG